MRKLIYLISVFATLGALSLVGCNEILEFKAANENPPTITGFSPTSAPIGSVISLYGEDLQRVDSIFLNDVMMPITERISSKEIRFETIEEGATSVITAKNPYGIGVSQEKFIYEYLMPKATRIEPELQVDMYGELLIRGENLSALKEVYFATPSNPTGNKATFTRDEKNINITVKVPYVEDAPSVEIIFTYFDGTNTVTTIAGEIVVKRLTPAVSTTVFARTLVGAAINLQGTNMNQIGHVTVGGFKANSLAPTPTEFSFTVPAGDFVEGASTFADIVIHYFDNNEEQTITSNLEVYVSPTIKVWHNVQTIAQARIEPLSAFFSPETGIVYNNGVWRTEVDPMSVAKSGAVCSATNVSTLTESEYNSVNPYFFFSGNNIGTMMISGPANSNGQLKNFYINTKNPTGTITHDNRLPGSNASWYGTPIITFRYLNPASVNPEEVALINKVKNGQIEEINEALFPIDKVAVTVAGVGMTSAKGSAATIDWAPMYVSGTDMEDVAIDAVFVVMYHKHSGIVNHVENVKRLGLLHIKEIDFRIVPSGSNLPPAASVVTYNVYWQKRDYNYSLIP